MNASLEAMSAALNPEAVAASVEATCRRLDETVEGLTAQRRRALADAGFGYAVARWAHREDHIDQIEAALA